MNLSGLHILVTGGARGIGDALCRELSSRGAHVSSIDTQEPVRAVDGVSYVSGDVSEEASVQRALSAINKPVDILINNAGIMRRGTITQSKTEDFDALFAVHAKGNWLMLKHSLSILSKNATIVQMSSRHALLQSKDPALYALTKKFAADMAITFQKTHPDYKLKILYMGPVYTAMSEMNRTAEEIEHACSISDSPTLAAEEIIKLLKDDEHRSIYYHSDTKKYTLSKSLQPSL